MSLSLISILGAATPDQVFKSMGQTLDESVNPNHILLIVAALVALIALIAVLNRRSSPKSNKPKVVHNSAKLLRQIARQVGLKPRELKQLKALAEQENVQNPLVLLLCPSVLQAAMKNRQWAVKK